MDSMEPNASNVACGPRFLIFSKKMGAVSSPGRLCPNEWQHCIEEPLIKDARHSSLT